jgi:hypothetical protein
MKAHVLLILAFAAGQAAAQPGGGLFPERDSIEYTLRATPASRSQDPGILENRVRGTFLIRRASDTWTIQPSLGSFHLDKAPELPGTGLAFPRDLREAELGAGFRRRLGERREWGLSTGMGSASDRPFDSIHETTVRATAACRLPARGRDSWLLLLSYSNNRSFANNIPLPGAAYMLRLPERGLEAMLGLPFLSVSWRPTPDWSGRFSMFGPNTVSAEWSFLAWKAAQPYGGFDWGQREWFRSRRPDHSQRLFFDEKRWTAGVRLPLPGKLRLDLAGVYGFSRRLYESDRARDSGVPAAELKPSWSFQAKAGVDW